MTEVELAKTAIEWLEADGWDVYQEVCPRGYGTRADIVATKDGKIRVVEAKKRMNWKLIDQGLRWRPYANEVWLLTEYHRDRWIIVVVLAKLGLGWINRETYDGKTWTIRKLREADHDSLIVNSRLIAALCAEQKTFAQAGSSGKFWTPFKRTVQLVEAYVKAHPSGVTARELEAGIDHHYDSAASARSGFIAVVERGLIPGVELDRSVKPIMIKPKKGD